MERFYTTVAGSSRYYSITDREYREVARPAANLSLSLLKSAVAPAEHNSAASVNDLGDGIFCLEFLYEGSGPGVPAGAIVLMGIARASRDRRFS